MIHTATATDSMHSARTLYIAFDMGKESWQFTCGVGGKARREGKSDRIDVGQGKRGLVAEVGKARQHFGLSPDSAVHAMYEAGRGGFWFARWLIDTGIKCLVVDPCCNLVDRRAKHRKNDAIDARALLDFPVRHITGDREVNIVPVPTPEVEGARELGRLLHRLGRVRRSLAFRVQSVLWKRGIDVFYRTGLQDELTSKRSGGGRPLDRMVQLEVEMLCGQIEVIDRDRQARPARILGAPKGRARQASSAHARVVALIWSASSPSAPEHWHMNASAGASSATPRRWVPTSVWRRRHSALVR